MESATEAGFTEAEAHSKSAAILVESFVTGFDHRMLVVNNKLVAKQIDQLNLALEKYLRSNKLTTRQIESVSKAFGGVQALSDI